MSTTADLVIIGAGIMGVSTAYHLARRGFGKIVILDREGVCGGATAWATGAIRHQFSTRTGVELTRRSVAIFERFEDEFGVQPGFRRTGYLWLGETEAEAALFRRNVAMQRELGVNVDLLDAAGVKALCPYLEVDDILAATYCPDDAIADPYLTTTAMAARVRELGVEIRSGWEVQAFLIEAGRVRGVQTNQGDLAAPAVLLAAGPWAGPVGRLAGLELPIAPRRREKLMSAPYPLERLPETPFIKEVHTAFAFERIGQNLFFFLNPRSHEPTFDTSADWELLPELHERIRHRCPILEDVSIVHAFGGLLEVTPDGNGIVDRAPGVEGLYLLGGFSGHGFMHGPSVGELMAELIADGRAHSLDISDYSLARFERGELELELLSSVRPPTR